MRLYNTKMRQVHLQACAQCLTGFIVPARHDPIDHLLAIERVLITHQRQRGQAPVDSIHSQMLSQMVGQLIAFLRVQTGFFRRWSDGARDK